MGVNTVQCTGLWVVPSIPKFKGRANWSRDTVQPMRRRACVYQNIDPVIKHFHNSGRSRTDFKINLQYSSRYHIISKKTFDVREQEYHSLQGIIGVFELIPDRSQRSWLHWHGLQDNSRRGECENLLRSYKTGLVLPINFYRTRIKEPVIITRIKSSSNLLIFLVCFFVLFVLTSSIWCFLCLL